jgi:hypothetical protein
VDIHHGRTTTVAGEPDRDKPGLQGYRPRPGHDCALSGCKPHTCKPMAKSTIRNIHSILSAAFDAAQRWEWTDRNPADSAKPPTVIQKKRPATLPADVVKVIEQARSTGQHDIALYVWLVAITGVRRGALLIHILPADSAPAVMVIRVADRVADLPFRSGKEAPLSTV